MSIRIRKFEKEDIQEMMSIWNEVVKRGNAFPQIEELNEEEAYRFFEEQSFTAVAEADGENIRIIYSSS